MKKILLLLILYIFLSCQKNENIIPEISFGRYFDILNMITYEDLEEENRQYYLELITAEAKKYPKEFYEKIGLDVIIIGKNLKYNRGYRAAIPENSMRIIFMGIKDYYTDDYIKYAFHHDLHHYTEFVIWQDYYYDWDEWRVLYHGTNLGGITAYLNGDYSYTVPYDLELPGFLNHYSTLGQEEDRAEIMGAYMTDYGNRILIRKAMNDELFFKKCIVLLNFYKENFNLNFLDDFLKYFPDAVLID